MLRACTTPVVGPDRPQEARMSRFERRFQAPSARISPSCRLLLPRALHRPIGALPALLLALLVGIPCAVLARSASAGTVQEFVRVRGLEGDVLVGMGLVVGLENTGDSMKDSTIAGQPYAQLLKTLGNIDATSRDFLKNKSVAIVMVTLEVPYGGSRIGDRMDVRVSTLGNAKSLKGGRLVSTYMLPDVVPADRSMWIPYAIAEGGPVDIGADSQTNGTIRRGGRVVRDIIKNPYDGDTVTLVLEPRYQSFTAAAAIAAAINDEESIGQEAATGVASVIDHQSIQIRIPQSALATRTAYLAQVLSYPMSADALRLRGKVIIDRRRKVITADESVQIRPSAVSADGLRIVSITPAPEPTPENPLASTSAWTGVATDARDRASTKLKDLVETFRQLDVPFDTQVAIIESLEKQGALTGEVVPQ
jgi:flagellar P-ring protein precursor FlgI